MQNLILSIALLFVAVNIQLIIGLPLMDTDDDGTLKRSDDDFLPNENFSLVTNEKLAKLKEISNAIGDPKLHELYWAVHHYVQMATKNHEYVLWKYDANNEGLVLVLRQNLNGILYYG